MHDFSLFLLEHLLPVGIAAIVFFLIGLMIAKFLWGRYSQRLSFAVEENLNLASQWSALGSSQRDLFKKLRSRWQEDRDAWESRLAEVEEQILSKESRIAQLTRQLESSGREIPDEPVVDEAMQEEVRRLKAEIERRDEKLAAFKEREDDLVPISPIVPVASGNSEAAEEENRLQELEQDLIDTHDELHQVREDYLKQVKLVESLEEKLIESEPASELSSARERIAELEASLEKARTTDSASAVQLASMLKQRSKEISGFRSEIKGLHSEVLSGHTTLEEKEAFLQEKDALIREKESLIAAREDEIRDLSSELSTRKAEGEEIIARLVLRGDEARELKSRLEERGQQVEDLKAQLTERALEIESLHLELEERNSEMKTLQARHEEATRASQAEAETLERKRLALQADLNDAHHEMYDVRKALRERLDEIEILDQGMDHLVASEDEALALANELKDTRHELSDVRMAYNAKLAEYQQLTAEMEELEAIIEDRGAEVNDLSSEVRQQRDLIRQLKDSLAEKEGELEALGEESSKFAFTLSAKETFLSEQTRRIADLEVSLAERYEELNDVRARMDDGEKAARYHESKAEQLSAEIERRRLEFEKSDHRITTAEEEIEEAHAKISSLTEQLAESDQTITALREELQGLSRDKDEVLRELDAASKRVEELENAARDRESRIAELEQEWNDSSRQGDELRTEVERLSAEIEAAHGEKEESGKAVMELEAEARQREDRLRELENELSSKSTEGEELLRKVETLNSEIEEANRIREASEASVLELEEALRSSDDKTMELSRLVEEKDEELESLKVQVAEMETRATEKEERIAEAGRELEILRAEMDERLEAAAQEIPDVEKIKFGEVIDQRDESIEKLKAEIEDREISLQQYVEQQKQSVEEIDQLRSKVAKRGDSIRELQNEISNIMMQRSARDSEIALLKDKLRAFETQLEKASRKQEGSAETIKNLEAAIHESLASENTEGGGGTSLDEIDESESHHAPAAVEAEETVSLPVPDAHEPEAESDDEEPIDDDSVYFDKSSAALTERSLGRIDEFARSLRRGGARASVAVIGFAGQEGSTDYNESISAKRADAVRERLIERGVPHSKIDVKNSGQDRRFTNWRARRVELVLIPNAVAESVN